MKQKDLEWMILLRRQTKRRKREGMGIRVPTGQMVPGSQESVEQKRVKMGDREPQQCSGFVGILTRSSRRSWVGDVRTERSVDGMGGQGAGVLTLRGKLEVSSPAGRGVYVRVRAGPPRA